VDLGSGPFADSHSLERARHEQTVSGFLKPAVARLGEAENSFDGAEGMTSIDESQRCTGSITYSEIP